MSNVCEWFKGEPTFQETPLRAVKREWICPKCEKGKMVFNGVTWLMNPEGYHHTCTGCGYTAALSGKHYPSIQYEVDRAEDVTCR